MNTEKKYQVYAIGNALVDFEIETTPQELQEFGVEKGVMTLIEEERQNQLMEAFHGKHHSRACGGSAANSIIGAQTLGSQCFYSCKVADDDTGHFFRDDLTSHGVHTNLSSQSLENGTTGKCLVMITEDADRTMNTFLGVSGEVGDKQVVESALLDSQYLYVEGYLSSSPDAFRAAVNACKLAKENGIKVAFSLSDPNMVKFCRPGIEAIIGDGVDLLFCNSDEATLYAEVDNVESAIDRLREVAVISVVTLGPKGSMIITQDNILKVEGYPVEAIDTNGAGDLFAGAFLHGLANGWSLETAGQLASYASSRLVTQFGPRLQKDKIEQVKAFADKLIN